MTNLNDASTLHDYGVWMIDNFSLLVSHGLMLLVAWRILFRRELEKEAPPKPDAEPQGWRKGRPRNA